MAKAVLVMDMPEICNDCMAANMGFSGFFCTAAHKQLIPKNPRPEWCPIRPMPEKENNDNLMDEYQDGYDDGWNACINAIGGGNDGTA